MHVEALQLFDKLAQHLLKQQMRCETKSGRAKSISKTAKDPVGTLLTKSMWNKEVDKKGIFYPGLPEKLGLDPVETEVVEVMQSIHDIVKLSNWEETIAICKKQLFPEA